jgi:sphingomyelin phosphodiesterase acid-like 3
LATAPAEQWKSILGSADSSDRDAQFAALEQKCHTRGEDTSYGLYASSLTAMQSKERDVAFITVSGDLIAHAFSCKYDALFPKSSPDAYQSFVEKTIQFVLGELRTTVPEARVYAALGNNDSDCGDYQLDKHSSFLSHLSEVIAEGLPPASRQSAVMTFADSGYYSAALPAPLEHIRLLVLDDTFMSRKYASCSGKPDSGGADAQMAWLRAQLAEARQKRQHVWVMGHIPPGIDPYSTAVKMRDVCGGSAPEMFLSSGDLPELLSDYGDVIQLALFAHTHMDEMRLLKPENAAASSAALGVAVKLVPSISPINGNAPSFTIATVEPTTATLRDYRVFVASDGTGSNGAWQEEYDYTKTYHQATFSAVALNSLIKGFQTDSDATTDPSEAYLRNYFVRDHSLELKLFWPQYVCALAGYDVATYKGCVCQHSNP